jgi:hypothetical protein
MPVPTYDVLAAVRAKISDFDRVRLGKGPSYMPAVPTTKDTPVKDTMLYVHQGYLCLCAYCPKAADPDELAPHWIAIAAACVKAVADLCEPSALDSKRPPRKT